MNIDLERVKYLTYQKIEQSSRPSKVKIHKILLVAAVVATSSVLMLGAARLFDWKVMVNGTLQQGNYGEPILVGDGFAAMSPLPADQSKPEIIRTNFPDSEPYQAAKAGELSLFGYQSEDGSVLNWLNGVTCEKTTELAQLQLLAENAEAKIHWPAAIGTNYNLRSSFIAVYTKQEQLKKAKVQYSNFGEWKGQQLISLPEGYDKYIALMNVQLETPEGKELCFFSHIEASNSQVYGGSDSSIIEALEVDGYHSVVFVSDNGWNQLYAWRKIPTIQSIDFLEFGEKERPSGNLLDACRRENTVYQWQQYSFDSHSLSKEELLQLLYSIDLSK
ncbi:MAG: hypothetical protein RR185_00445 [Angelakisella sp.]